MRSRRLPRPAEQTDALIDRIYAAAADPDEWKAVLDALLDTCGDGVGVLMVHDHSRRDGSFAVATRMEGAWKRLYDQYFAARNPWLDKLPKRPVGLAVPAELMLARDLGIAKETARHQMKSIFDKTGVRRQAELSVLLMRVAPPGMADRQ